MRDHLGNFILSSDLSFAKGIMLLDNCEGTSIWDNVGTGADHTVSYETTAAFTGLKGLKVMTRATDPAEDDTCLAGRRMEFPESGLLVFRTKVGLPDVSLVKHIFMNLNIHDGSDLWVANLVYEPNTPKAYYANSAGALVEITEFAYGVTDGCWLTMELVMDLNQMEYISAYLNGITKKLTGLGFQDIGNLTTRQVQVALQVVAAGAVTAYAYFDSLYVGEYINI